MQPVNSPGCFGSPLAFDARSHPCSVCPFKAGCDESSRARALRLRERYRIDLVLRPASRHVVPDVVRIQTPDSKAPDAKLPGRMTPDALRSALPKKGIEALQRWAAKGINLKRSVGQGANPFDGSTSFMRLIMRDLLAGGFTRREAVATLVAELGWVEASASSHVGFSIPLLIVVGAAVEIEGRIVPYNHTPKEAIAA